MNLYKFAGGSFILDILIPDNYPFVPPKVRCLTKISHVNISPRGNICLDVLRRKWTPVMTISKIVMYICSLLYTPNPEDPLVPDLAR